MTAKKPKVLLYTEFEKQIRVSGLGKAIQHQKQALEDNGFAYTLSPREDYDIVHLNFYGLKSYRLAKRAHKRGKKVVYHAHSTEEDFRNSFIFSNQLAPLFKWWITRCYRFGDVILTPTPYSKRLLEGYGLQNIHAISNGVNLENFRRDEKLGAQFRAEYHYGVKERVIVGIGLYLERKGILDFVELARRLPEYQFIWFGYTNPRVVPRKVRRAVETKLPNLKFAGHVPQEMIRAALSGADLYVFPTLEETEGIPALEACACRTPLIARDIPVFEGWLKAGASGDCAHFARDVDDFERQIRAFFAGQLPDLTKKAHQMVQNYDTKVVGQQLIEIYRQLSV